MDLAKRHYRGQKLIQEGKTESQAAGHDSAEKALRNPMKMRNEDRPMVFQNSGVVICSRQ